MAARVGVRVGGAGDGYGVGRRVVAHVQPAQLFPWLSRYAHVYACHGVAEH